MAFNADINDKSKKAYLIMSKEKGGFIVTLFKNIFSVEVLPINNQSLITLHLPDFTLRTSQ